MVAELPLVSVNLATVCIESALYGCFCLLFSISFYLLYSRHSSMGRGPFLTTLLVSSVLIFLTITGHWICTFLRLFQAFVLHNDGSTPLAFYADLTQTSEVVKTGFLIGSLVIGDAIIIYRLWIVWNYNKAIIIFPIGTLCGLTACGVGITYQFTQYKPVEDVFNSAAGRWITSNCVFTLCTNAYSTILIAWRVWSINAPAKHYSGKSLNSVLATIIESAAIYTSWSIFFFASYRSGSNLQFIAVDGWPVMSGIAFMLINVRVGLGWAQQAPTETGFSGQQVGSATIIASRIEQLRSRGGNGESFGMRPLAVNITQDVDKEAYGDGKVDTATQSSAV